MVVDLTDDATRIDAELIAAEIGGRVTGIAGNTYQFEIPASTILELDAAIQKLLGLAESDHKIENVLRNRFYKINL